MSARDDNFNLKLELVALLLVLFSVSLVALGSVMAFTIVGIEYVEDPTISKPDQAQLGPYGYAIALAVFFMPAGFLVVVASGLRLFFVRIASVA